MSLLQAPAPVRDSILSGILVVSALSGCAQTTAPRTAELRVDLLRPTFAAAAHADQAVAGRVADEWSVALGDPRIAGLMREAVSHNWDLLAAEERVAQARLLAARAGATLGPIVDGVASASRSDPGAGIAPNEDYRVGLAAVWELDVWGRVRSAERAAEFDAAAAEADLAALRLAIAAQTAQSWILMTVATQQVAVDEELLVVRRRTLEVAEARLARGVAQPLDVSVARADVSDAESLLAGSRQTLTNAIRSVELLIGRYPSAELAADADMPGLPPQVPIGLPSELLERRPDVLAADRRVAAAFHVRESASAARLPRIALTGELGTASDELSDVLDADNAVWSLGGNLIAPLFDGGQRRIDVQIAESQQSEALNQYVSTALAAFEEVERALTAESTLAQQQRLLESGVEDLTKARSAAELRYRRGLLSIFDLTQVEARLFAARRDLVSSRGARVIQRIDLHLALGGPFEATGQPAPDSEQGP